MEELAVVMTDNARLVWKTELDNEDYDNYAVKFYETGILWPLLPLVQAI